MTKLEDLLWENVKKTSTEKEEEPKDSLATMNFNCMTICCGMDIWCHTH